MEQNENKYEDSKLVSLLADDSEYAFLLIYDRYRKRIYQIAPCYLRSSIIAQYVVQDVILNLWYHIKDFNIDKSIEEWIYTVAKNNLHSRIKKIPMNGGNEKCK